MLVVLLTLQIAAGAPAATSSAIRDSVSTVSRLRQEASDFVWVWRFYWEASEAARHGIEGGLWDPNPQMERPRRNRRRVTQDRMNRLHCHPDGREGFPIMSTVIPERRRSLRALCPEWSTYLSPNLGDERTLDRQRTDRAPQIGSATRSQRAAVQPRARDPRTARRPMARRTTCSVRRRSGRLGRRTARRRRMPRRTLVVRRTRRLRALRQRQPDRRGLGV